MAFAFRLPDIGEGIAEGEIVQWLVSVGDTVHEDQPLVEIMTDKVTAEIPSPIAGVVKTLHGNPGDILKVGAVMVTLEPVDAGAKGLEPAEASIDPAAMAAGANGNHQAQTVSAGTVSESRSFSGSQVLAAPATRKLARELGVDLALLSGSGPRGRVTPADVRRVSEGGVSRAAAGGGSPHVPQPKIAEAEKRVPFIGMRRKIAEHLSKSKQTAPHFAYVEEVDMTALVSLRGQLKDDAQQRGAKLTYLPFILKAVIRGLRAFPVLNSMLDEGKGELVYKQYYHLGIATATDQGLIVPVVKFADQKDIFTLAAEIQDLSDRARRGALKPDEVSGGTFTLTSIGSIGGLFGVPIINLPEVAILGVNKISPRPVVREGQIVVRDMMYLSLCCDHRVVDGAEAALFTQFVIEQLEKPARLILD